MTELPYHCRVYLLDGATIDVHTDIPTTARLLWGTDGGDDAHDMGYAALLGGGRIQHVEPEAVSAIGPIPTCR